MTINELLLETAELKDEIQAIIHDSYLFTYIEPPIIDEDKIFLLCSMAKQIHHDIRKELIISTMLVQIALDIHERVIKIDYLQEDHKTRQLTVLAGDYYSSLYYERLSKINEITLIQRLANGIRKINEQKTNFLYGKNLTQEHLLVIIREIESCLLNQFSLAVNSEPIPQIIQEFFLLKRLLQEQNKIMENKFSLWVHLFGRQLFEYRTNKTKIALLRKENYSLTVQVIADAIEVSKSKLLSLLQSTKNKDIAQFIENELIPHLEVTNAVEIKMAEEG